MTVPPDDRSAGDPPGDEDRPAAGAEPPAEDGPADDADVAADATDDPVAEDSEQDDAVAARGLVVVGEHPDVPAVDAPAEETAGPVVVTPVPFLDELEEEGDPARRWKIAVAVLGIAVIVLAAVAISRGGSSAEAGTPVTPEQETALDNVATVPADELAAKTAKISQLQQESADAAAAAEKAAADNAALQTQLAAATAQAKAAEAAAQQAITDAKRSGNSAAEANRQVDALTRQVESLNRQIGSLTAETTALANQNAQLQQANQDLAAQNGQVTAQLVALDGAQTKLTTCTHGLAEALQQQDDPSWWEQHGDATTQACTDAQAAIDAYNAKFG